jgi:hypothetical protein
MAILRRKPKAQRVRPGGSVSVDSQPVIVGKAAEVIRHTIVSDVRFARRQGWEGEFDWDYDVVKRGHLVSIKLEHADKRVLISRNFFIPEKSPEKVILEGAKAVGKSIADRLNKRTAEQPTKFKKARRKTKPKPKSNSCKICGEVDSRYADWEACPHAQQRISAAATEGSRRQTRA